MKALGIMTIRKKIIPTIINNYKKNKTTKIISNNYLLI